MWWNYGAVSAVGAQSYSITAEATVGPEIDVFLGYYNAKVEPDQNIGGGNVLITDQYDISEIAFTVSKSFGPLDTSIAFIWDDYTDKNLYPIGTIGDNDEKVTTFQIYLTYNF
jgi:hypothetical protein